MSIFAHKNTKVLVQGITGTQASFHVRRSLEYGTNIVAGVTPGKGRTEHLGLPVFNTVKEAVEQTGANASVLFVPAKAVKGAVTEAAEAGLDLAVCITDGVPVLDMLQIKEMLKSHKTLLIGPNTPGLITPEEARLGIFPENIHQKGRIGIVSRSSTLTYEAVLETNRANMGQSTVIGLGDDMVIGSDYIPSLDAFAQDDETDAIVLIGQQGGGFEEAAAKHYKTMEIKKPVIAFVAGNSIPFAHKMGYAGEVIADGKTSVIDKRNAMLDAGMIVVDEINQIHQVLLDILS